MDNSAVFNALILFMLLMIVMVTIEYINSLLFPKFKYLKELNAIIYCFVLAAVMHKALYAGLKHVFEI